MACATRCCLGALVAAQGWLSLGEHVRRERAQRRQTQQEFAESIGLSVRTLGSIEAGTGTRYDRVTRDVIEWALGWAPGSIELVVEGGQPRVEVDPTFARVRDAWPRLPVEARRLIAGLVERALDGQVEVPKPPPTRPGKAGPSGAKGRHSTAPSATEWH
jgi:transcriptional regulator with XRE-family HTH domain